MRKKQGLGREYVVFRYLPSENQSPEPLNLNLQAAYPYVARRILLDSELRSSYLVQSLGRFSQGSTQVPIRKTQRLCGDQEQMNGSFQNYVADNVEELSLEFYYRGSPTWSRFQTLG